MRSKYKAFLFSAILFLQPLLAEAITVRDVLNNYVGKWSGSVSGSGTRNNLRRIKVQQQYWWDGQALKGIGAYEENGKLTSSSIKIFVDGKGRLFKSITYNGEQNNVKNFVGMIRESVITWIPTNVLEATKNQITESFKIRNGQTILTIKHLHKVKIGKKIVPKILTGELAKTSH